MSELIFQAEPAASPTTEPAIRACRLRFVAEPPVGTTIRREFKQPRRLFAIEEAVGMEDLPDRNDPERADACFIVFAPKEAKGDALRRLQAWISAPERSDAEPTLAIYRDQETVQWRPGRALVQGRAECRDEIVAALTDFAFFEGELRALEAELETREEQARDDAACTSLSRRADALRKTDRELSRMRLTFARLEPELYSTSRILPTEARRLIPRLSAGANVEARLEGFSDRLEALQELYQSAGDRIDGRRGHRIEIWIIVILVIECLIMTGDLLIHKNTLTGFTTLWNGTRSPGEETKRVADAQKLVEGAKLSLGEAIGRALKDSVRGKAVGASLENDSSGNPRIYVSVARGKQTSEIEIDAANGEIVARSVAERDSSAISTDAKLSLDKAIELALKKAPGSALSAEFAYDGEDLEAQVQILSGGKLKTVYVSAETGEITAIE